MNNENNNNPNGLNSMINQNAGINNMVNQNAGINNMVNQNAGITQNVNQPVQQVTTPGVEAPMEEEQVCSKCGFKLSKTSPICIHCGTPVMEDSQKIAAAFDQNPNYINKEEYLIGEEYLENKKKFLLPMLIVNGILLLLVIIAVVSTKFMNPSSTTYEIGNITVGIIIISFYAFIMFYQTCIQILLCKASISWWLVYIPGIGEFVISKLMTDDWWYVLGLIIPTALFKIIIDFLPATIASGWILLILTGALLIYNLIFSIKMNNKFAHRFHVNAALLFFFPLVMIPIMALNDTITCD